MSDVQELYPFSTEKGTAVPLDIVQPLSAIRWNIAAETAKSATVPTNYSLVAIYSSIDIFLDFENSEEYPILEDIAMINAVFVPGQCLLTMKIPQAGAIKIIPANSAEGGYVTMTNLRKWAGIALARQLGNY